MEKNDWLLGSLLIGATALVLAVLFAKLAAAAYLGILVSHQWGNLAGVAAFLILATSGGGSSSCNCKCSK